MRVSREKSVESRERILEAAATLFREKGFDGIGLVDIMKAAGLTHGGFYGHFGSKEDLEAQALGLALARSVTDWSQLVDCRFQLKPATFSDFKPATVPT